MRLDWGQGKFEVEKHRQEILDILADGWTLWKIFQPFNHMGCFVPKTTFYRTVKKMRAPALASLSSQAASQAARRKAVASAAESLSSEPFPAPLAVPWAQSSLEESFRYIKKLFSDEEFLWRSGFLSRFFQESFTVATFGITTTDSTDADYVVIDTGTSNVLALLGNMGLSMLSPPPVKWRREALAEG